MLFENSDKIVILFCTVLILKFAPKVNDEIAIFASNTNTKDKTDYSIIGQ
ncbi:MAG: hypothetical protein ACK504_01150 [Bacteroidota bacterium]